MSFHRATVLGWVWRGILRPVLFLCPAELTHNLTMGLFSWLTTWIPGCRRVVAGILRVEDSRLHIQRFGVEFPNPVGMSAGMDKNAAWCDALGALGFGYLEVGTVTARKQTGKSKPRVYRLPKDQAVLNRMGCPNKGAAAVAGGLASRPPKAILGVNIGKSAAVPNEEANADYLESFERLFPFASYFALNVSSPNTQGLRDLQASAALSSLLLALKTRNAELASSRQEPQKPLLVKIAPDLDEQQLDSIVDLCIDLEIDGIIVANTTISREGLKTSPEEVQSRGDGGISGRPLTQRSRALVATVYRKTNGDLPIIGVGGIMTEDDAWEMIRAGASLIQVHTGLIYAGPSFVASINRYLLARLAESGKSSLEEVIGEATRQPSSDAGQLAVGSAATLPG